MPEDRTEVKNGTLTINSVTRNDGETYNYKAENNSGIRSGHSACSSRYCLLCNLKSVLRILKEITPVIGASVHLPCVAKRNLKPTITWTKDGKILLPVDTSFLQHGALVMQNITKSRERPYITTNGLTTIGAKVRMNSQIGTYCTVIRKYVSNVSRNYVINPDSAGGLATFIVYCDKSDNGVDVTVISHDSECRMYVKGFKAKGSYSRDIHYTGASLSQLAGRTRVFSHC